MRDVFADTALPTPACDDALLIIPNREFIAFFPFCTFFVVGPVHVCKLNLHVSRVCGQISVQVGFRIFFQFPVNTCAN